MHFIMYREETYVWVGKASFLGWRMDMSIVGKACASREECRTNGLYMGCIKGKQRVSIYKHHTNTIQNLYTHYEIAYL